MMRLGGLYVFVQQPQVGASTACARAGREIGISKVLRKMPAGGNYANVLAPKMKQAGRPVGALTGSGCGGGDE